MQLFLGITEKDQVIDVSHVMLESQNLFHPMVKLIQIDVGQGRTRQVARWQPLVHRLSIGMIDREKMVKFVARLEGFDKRNQQLANGVIALSAQHDLFKVVMLNARKELRDIDLQGVGQTGLSRPAGHALYGGMRSLSGQVPERVVDEAAAPVSNQMFIKHPLHHPVFKRCICNGAAAFFLHPEILVRAKLELPFSQPSLDDR